MQTKKIKSERERVQIDCSQPVLTDQSYKKSSDINNIMKQYAKTKMLPSYSNKIARYVDNTNIPDLMQAHAIVNEAKSLFEAIPAQIRKLMDNDPSKMAEFISNPENKNILIQYGVLEQPKESALDASEVKEAVKADAPSSGN